MVPTVLTFRNLVNVAVAIVIVPVIFQFVPLVLVPLFPLTFELQTMFAVPLRLLLSSSFCFYFISELRWSLRGRAHG